MMLMDIESVDDYYRLRNIASVVIAVLMLSLLLFFKCVGELRPAFPPTESSGGIMNTDAFLAPSAKASLPTTIRVKVWIHGEYLPIKACELDPDGDRGALPAKPVDMRLWREIGAEGPGTGLYFDIPWTDLESAQSVLTVHCLKGNYESVIFVSIPALQPWPDKS